MSIKIIDGNIFTSNAQTMVNTINCVGVMGAGIALECRFRYPEMYTRYVELCEQKQINIGLLWLYKTTGKWILNFPTKTHWKYPSKKEYLERGLEKFISTFSEKGIESIAFPLLGADKGGIDSDVSLEIIQRYLSKIDLDVEIYRYNAKAKDELFDKTKLWLSSNSFEYLTKATKIRAQYLRIVLRAIESENIFQLNQLAKVKGVGINTLEKIFAASRKTQ